MASANGHKEIVELLLKSVDDDFRKTLVKAQNVSGNTPLHWAALNGLLNLNCVSTFHRACGSCKFVNGGWS